jgi:hypothetical protein
MRSVQHASFALNYTQRQLADSKMLMLHRESFVDDLGVKGSQVRILSSRRLHQARWLWGKPQASRLFRARLWTFAMLRNGHETIVVGRVKERISSPSLLRFCQRQIGSPTNG